jgi:hypothetical protein
MAGVVDDIKTGYLAMQIMGAPKQCDGSEFSGGRGRSKMG